MPHATAIRSNSTGDDNSSNTRVNNKPVEKFTDGPVRVSIWENKSPKGAFRTASFEIRFRDTNDQWQTSHSYSSTTLLHLESAAREARSRIEIWRQNKGQAVGPAG